MSNNANFTRLLNLAASVRELQKLYAASHAHSLGIQCAKLEKELDDFIHELRKPEPAQAQQGTLI